VSTLVTSPDSYVALAAWPLAAAVMSVLCSRATRVGAFIGATTASVLFWCTYLLADKTAQLLGQPGGWVGTELNVSVGASLILMVLVVVLGAPLRPEQDAEFDE
jgi:hypothetical protein